MTGTVHAHVSTWFIALLLFVVAIVLNKLGKTKAEKIVTMILRLLYLLIITTGVMLLRLLAEINMDYILKTLAGLLVIAMFEMILARMRKGKSSALYWLLFILAFASALYLGYSLPL